MRRTLLTVFTCLTLLPMQLVAQSSARRDTSALRREVETLVHGMEAAFARGDMKAVAAFYADNAVIRSAHAVGAAGRAQVDAYWTRIQNPKRWTLDVFGVTAGEGTDLVYHTGRSTAVFGSPEQTNVFQFLVVWQRLPTGELKIILDYYHVPEPG